MSARMTVTGFAQEPRQRVSQSGKPLLDVGVAHNKRRKNQSGQWENATDKDGNELVMWVRATFFEDEALFLANEIRKGDFIELEGEPMVRAYTDNSGSAKASVELSGAVVKKLPRAARGGGSNASSAAPGTGGGFGGFGAAGGDFSEQPF